MADFGLDTANKSVKKVVKETVKAYVADKVNGTPAQKGAAATYAGTLVDATWDAAMSKPVSTTALITAVGKNISAITGLSDDQTTQCLGALIALGANVAEASAQVTLMAGEEVASAGFASPAVVIQACLLVNNTADAARSAVKANQQCGPLAGSTYKAMQTTQAGYIKQTEQALQDLSSSIEHLYRSQYF